MLCVFNDWAAPNVPVFPVLVLLISLTDKYLLYLSLFQTLFAYFSFFSLSCSCSVWSYVLPLFFVCFIQCFFLSDFLSVLSFLLLIFKKTSSSKICHLFFFFPSILDLINLFFLFGFCLFVFVFHSVRLSFCLFFR